MLKKYIIFITVGINFLLLPSLVIKYIHSQEADRLTPDSIMIDTALLTTLQKF